MKCRRLNTIGTGSTTYRDVSYGHGMADFLTGDEAIVQAIACELRFQLGEWFLDATKGIPWLQNPNTDTRAILGRFPADLGYASAMIKAAILRVDGVASIDNFDISLNHVTRATSATVKGTLVSGQSFTVTEAPG